MVDPGAPVRATVFGVLKTPAVAAGADLGVGRSGAETRPSPVPLAERPWRLAKRVAASRSPDPGLVSVPKMKEDMFGQCKCR